MRTYLYRPICFVVLLVICLMFAPARYFTGDHSIYPVPAATLPVPVSSNKSFAELCREEPVDAIAQSLGRYRSDVEGYSCTFLKQERINGELRKREVIVCDFRESPFAVKMRWTEGHGRAIGMLYPAGERTDRLAVVPSNEVLRKAIPYTTRSLNDSSVREASRYPVTEFGIYHGLNRVYLAWKNAKDQGLLKTEYEGVRAIPELNGRTCHVLRRDCVTPEEEGLTQVTLFFDTETLLQAGAVLKADDELIASYHFRDLMLNPKFAADHFAMEKLK